ncbi:MAG: hypothetical protein LUE31_00895 [Lachnospiraceae bacterium]|nr:hypothetical protein [Lachnospiraceae bacterium]
MAKTRRLAELVYVVPEEREQYIEKHLKPTKEVEELLWTHGISNQTYFRLNEFILIVFDYDGRHLYEDMDDLASYPSLAAHMISKRRKDVPVEERATTNWWAPLKKLGVVLEESPMPDDDDEPWFYENYHEMQGGKMGRIVTNDISYDEDDWSESVHI